MEQTNNSNPWKGLKTYTEGETLYGRNEEIQSLSLQIMQNTQTVVYGRSGIGKSSIINAGIFPIIRLNHIFPISIRLEHNASPYVDQIKSAIFSSLKKLKKDIYNEQGEKQTVFVEGSYKELVGEVEGEETLWRFFHRYEFYNDREEKIVPMIVLDQFEEIFTLEKDHRKVNTFFKQLADLINEIVPDDIVSKPDNPALSASKSTDITDDGLLDLDDIDLDGGTSDYLTTSDFHIVFTLREDYLSYLERNTTNIPALKNNRYCLQPINEEQAASIIMSPIPGLISLPVAKRIIEKVTNETDFSLGDAPEIEVDSAILSLFMSELYAKKGDNDIITIDLVDVSGGNIIQSFYEKNMDDTTKIKPGSVVFLEDELISDGHRDSIAKSYAMNKGGITEKEIEYLKDLRLLNEYQYNQISRLEFMHDVLCQVILLRKQQRIEQQSIEELERKTMLEKRKMRRIIALTSILCICIGGMFAAYYWATDYVRISYYKQYERRNGWPIGLGEELSAMERSTTPLYYKLSHKGWLNYDTDVEVCSSNDRLPHSSRIASLEVNENNYNNARAQEYLAKLSKIKSIHFVGGEHGNVDKEIVRDENDSILFIMSYFYLDNKNEAWAHFLTSSGQSMKVSDNGLDRFKLSWDSLGRVQSFMYYDEKEVCCVGADSINGYQLKFSEDGMTTYRYALDQFGRMKAAHYNVMISRMNADTLETRFAKALSVNDPQPVEVTGPSGYSRIVEYGDKRFLYAVGDEQPIAVQSIKKDGKGNIVEERIEGQIPSIIPAIVRYSYDKNGWQTSKALLNADETPYIRKQGDVYKKCYEYNNDGTLTSEIHYAATNGNRQQVVYSHKESRSQNVITDEEENLLEDTYIRRVDSLYKDRTVTSYFGKNNICINQKVLIGEDSLLCHKVITYKTGDNIKYHCYQFNPDTEQIEPLRTTLENGTYTSYYCKEENYKDGNLLSFRIFDTDNAILKSMMFFYQNGQRVAQAAMGIDGNPVRCPYWENEGFAYYKLYYIKDNNDQYVDICGTNEWEQKSIFYDDAVDKQYYEVSYKNYKGYNMLVNGGEMPIRFDYKQYNFEKACDISSLSVPYLHILNKNSSFYANGLKDGDRIVSFGKWRLGQPDALLAGDWAKMQSGSEISMTVLRPTAIGLETISKSFRYKKADIPTEEYHVYALTNDEKKLFNQYYKRYE